MNTILRVVAVFVGVLVLMGVARALFDRFAGWEKASAAAGAFACVRV
jgi:hypothetical protein